jgi:integrase
MTDRPQNLESEDSAQVLFSESLRHERPLPTLSLVRALAARLEILAPSDGLRFRAQLLLTTNAAPRGRELKVIQWQDIDLDVPHVMVARTASSVRRRVEALKHRSRCIPLSLATLHAVLAWREATRFRDGGDYLFPNSNGGLSVSSPNRFLEIINAEAKGLATAIGGDPYADGRVALGHTDLRKFGVANWARWSIPASQQLTWGGYSPTRLGEALSPAFPSARPDSFAQRLPEGFRADHLAERR